MLPTVVNWLSQHHRRLSALRSMGLVVKVGGSIQDDPAQMRAVMRDVAALASLEARPVVIHGGGKAITAAMAKAGLQARFVQGQRYTDPATLEIVEKVLAQTVNRELLGYLEDEGCRCRGLTSMGSAVLMGVRTGTDPQPGKPSEDLGLVGRVTKVNVPEILGVCEGGVVPVIAPVAREASPPPDSPGKLNVNADLAAGTVAAALNPRMFVLVSDTPGVRSDVNKPESSLPVLTRGHANELIASGAIAGGMLPKLQACFEALDGGVQRVCIVDGREGGALLQAVLAGPKETISGTWVTG